MGEVALRPSERIGGNVEVLPAAVPRYRGIIPANMDDSLRMAKVIVAGGMAPKSYFSDKVDPVAAVWTAIQLGGEIGLTPMASIQNIAVINGKPGLYGVGQLAVIQASGLLVFHEEGVEGEGDARAGWCAVQRLGGKLRRGTFSVADAKKAQLWSKSGPWSLYPDRMLLARARSFLLRDTFPDVLLGLAHSVEELQDIGTSEAPAPASVETDYPRAGRPAVEESATVPDVKTVQVEQPDGDPMEFPWTVAGFCKALEFIKLRLDLDPALGARLVLMNGALLEYVGRKLPQLAEQVAEINAAANRALMPPEDAAGAESEEVPAG